MKTRGSKKAGILLGAIVLVLIIIALAAPLILDLNRYHGLIVSEVEKAVGGTVKLGRISWGVAHRVWLEVDGFSVVGASAFPGDVKLTRLYTSISIPQLLTKKVVLKNLRLELSEVNFRLQPVAKDIGPSAGGTYPTGVHLPVEIEIQQMAVAIKRLELDDALSLPGQTLMHVFTDVDLTATNIAPAKVMTFNLALRDKAPSGLGSLKAHGTFSGLTKALTLENPDLKLQATLNTLHVDAIKPYLKNSLLENQLAGSISMEVNYEGDLFQNLRAQGAIDLSQITYSNPSLWDTTLPGRNTSVSFQISIDPQNFIAEKIAFKLGTLSMDARGVLHSWKKEQVIKNAEFSFNLPLVDLIPLIPWKQLGENAAVIRPILVRGGIIELTKVVLPEISLTKLPENLASLLPEIEMTAQVAGVSMQPILKIPKIQNIEGTVQLANGIAQVQGLKARIASIDLPPIFARITNLLEKPKIDAIINGRLKLDAIANEKFQKLLENIGLEKVVGAADLDLSVELETARPADFQLQGNIGLKDFQVKTVYTPASLHGLNAKVAIMPAVVNISQVSAIVALPNAAISTDDHFTLKIQGHVDDWRSKPLVTLQNVKTSQISLPLLASMVPWEKLGQSAKPVKEILDAGGFITIDALSLFAIDLSKLPQDLKNLLPRVRLVTSLTDITVPRGLSPTKVEGITGRVNLENNILVAENVHSRLGAIALPILNIRATDVADHFKLAFRAKGPLLVAAADDEQVEKLLLKYGLKALTGSADIDVSAEFDQRRPNDWTVNGAMVLKGVRAETHPETVVMNNLNGAVHFNRDRVITIAAQDLSAQINQAPVKLSGRFINVGEPDMLIETKVHAKQLDLSDMAAFIPSLKAMKPSGNVDMDLDVHIPLATPAKSRLTGTLATRNVGFKITAADLSVESGDTQIVLAGDSATVKIMTLRINEQQIAVSGQLSNPLKPKAILLITSPDLNLDRFLVQKKPKNQKSTGEKDQGEKPAIEVKSSKKELPPLARKLTADLQMKAAQGRYRGLQFQKLNLNLRYKHGAIEHYALDFGVDQGRVHTKGTADLRDLGRVTFSVDPKITALQLEKLAPVFGFEKPPISGPMFLTGQLQGHTGNRQKLLTSLAGNLKIEMGPGRVTNAGRAGDLILKIFSMTSIRGIFSGSIVDDLKDQGIPFRKIKSQNTFGKGVMGVKGFQFVSDAMMMTVHGKDNLIEENYDLEIKLEPLRSVGKAIGSIPLIGKTAEDLTEIYLKIKGPYEKPEIRLATEEEIGEAVKSEAKAPGTVIKKVEKGVMKIF
jgi:hypothetical protein